jgi:hypothetical protein
MRQAYDCADSALSLALTRNNVKSLRYNELSSFFADLSRALTNTLLVVSYTINLTRQFTFSAASIPLIKGLLGALNLPIKVPG